MKRHCSAKDEDFSDSLSKQNSPFVSRSVCNESPQNSSFDFEGVAFHNRPSKASTHDLTSVSPAKGIEDLQNTGILSIDSETTIISNDQSGSFSEIETKTIVISQATIKSERQRASELRYLTCMRDTPTRCAIVIRMFNRVVRSPSSKDEMKLQIARNKGMSDFINEEGIVRQKEATSLQKKLNRIQIAKIKKEKTRRVDTGVEVQLFHEVDISNYRLQLQPH